MSAWNAVVAFHETLPMGPLTPNPRDPSGVRFVSILMRYMVACLLLVACSSSTEAPLAASDDQSEAIAYAKACVDKNGYKPVWNTTIATDKISASHVRERQWVVSFPETGHDKDGNVVMLGLPQGMMLDVDLDAKSCRQMMLE